MKLRVPRATANGTSSRDRVKREPAGTSPDERYALDEIPESLRGDLCASCGKCCRVMILDGLPIDRRFASERAFLEWIDLHDASSTLKRAGGRQTLTVTIPQPCSKLLEEGGRSRCGIYESRPLTCHEYSCLEDDDIGDTAWKRYIREQRRDQD